MTFDQHAAQLARESAEQTRQFLVNHEWINTGSGIQWVPAGTSAVAAAPATGIWRPTPPNQGHWFSHH